MGKKFDFEKFEKEKIAVHCKTQEESDSFNKTCIEHNLSDCYALELFNVFRSETCYTHNDHIMYGSKNWCADRGYTILEWSDYMEKEFTKADLKPGMVVQYRGGDLRMVAELENGDLHFVGSGMHAEVKDYKDDLTTVCGDLYRDVIFVYSLSNIWENALVIGKCGRTVLFERKEPLKMNIEEAQEKLTELLEKEVEIVFDTDEDEEW